MRAPFLVFAFSFVACRQAGPSDTPPLAGSASADATAGVSDPKLAAVLAHHWEETMRLSPVFATSLGDHRYDDRLGDRSDSGIQEARKINKGILADAKAIDAASLPAKDRVTLALFVEQLESELGGEACRFEHWNLSPRGNPFADYAELVELHQIKTPSDGEHLLARYRQIPSQVDAEIGNLRRGAKDGLYANAESVKRTLAMLSQELKKPVTEWGYAVPISKGHGWTSEDEARFKERLLKILEEELKPSFENYRKFVEHEIAPHARGLEQTGLGALPIGKACYASQIREYTNLDRSADEIHQVGLVEVERINGEMKVLGKKVFGTDDFGKITEKLRTDQSLRFKDEAEIRAAAERALGAAKAAIPKVFGVLPKADCVVANIPDHEAPFTTIAYYRQPIPDGSRPGEFCVNVYQPTTRPRFEMEVLAFHESIPGHHLQIAIAQELPEMPAFRKHLGATAFVEGWAVYTERLADEMGLYSGDLDRLGMLSFDAWRASRLVVDTGIHAKGWTREQAKKFMFEHTALAENNIDNEVDRYIVWPGQALAYKTGQMEIWRLRHEAEATLGEKFDLKAFHDAVLTGGAVTMAVLAEQVHAYAGVSADKTKGE